MRVAVQTLRAALIAAISLVLCAPAWGAGTIAGLSLAPQPACVGQPVTATVDGTGTCNKLVVIWEEGGSVASGKRTILEPPPPFPVTLQHTYDAAGAVLVTAQPGAGSDCQGFEQRSLSVLPCEEGGWLEELCRIIDCSSQLSLDARRKALRGERRAVALAPTITGGLGAIQPGAPLLIDGDRFGDVPGKVLLLATNGLRELVVNEWYPGAIGGTVPTDLGNLCLTGEVQVITYDSRKSNIWRFSVLEAYRSLPAEDVRVVRCGGDGNLNDCNSVRIEGEACAYFGCPCFLDAMAEGAAVWGSHCNCCLAVGDDEGTDVYEVGLANGWVLEHASFVSVVPAGEGFTRPSSGRLPPGFVSGSATWRPAIEWSVTPGDTLSYGLWIDIRGPACVSHK